VGRDVGVRYERYGPVSTPRIVAEDAGARLELDVRRVGQSREDVRLEFRVVDGDRESAWVFIDGDDSRELLEKLAQALRDAPPSSAPF